MTMMMNTPDDSDYQALLQDYVAPLEDDGFSDVLLKQISDQQKQAARLKLILVGFACSLGGVIAGTQVKAFLTLMSENVSMGSSVWVITMIAVFAFVVWATLDNREAGPL